MLNAHELYENGDIQLSDFNILFGLLNDYSQKLALIPGYKVFLENPSLSVETALFPEVTNEESVEQVISNSLESFDYETKLNDKVKIRIPKEAIDMAHEQGVGSVRLRITAYSPDLFYHWSEKENKTGQENGKQYDNGGGNENATFESWRVLDIELQGANVENLTHQLEYTLQMKTNKSFGGKCVFWDDNCKLWLVNSSAVNNFM